METILIADSGSSKTDWLLIQTDGTVLNEWHTLGINPFYQPREAIFSLIKTAVFPQISVPPTAIFFYGAGCVNAEISAPIADALRECFPRAAVEIESDLLAAARSLCQHEPGIACILGTGSNNCLYDGTAIIGNIGSLGFWMGDEGSGGYLGKQLVVGFLHNELPRNLMVAFSERYPEVNRLEVLDRAYKQPFPNRYFARYTHFIADNRSDAYLQALLEEAFNSFLEKYVMKHPGAENYPISFVGSVAWVFKEALIKVLSVNGLRPGSIVQAPLPGLQRFHLETPTA